jgi:hypothetical protein
MLYDASKYAFMFNQPHHQISIDEYMAGHDYIDRYRVFTTKHGDRLTMRVSPVWNTRSQVRAARKNATREQQQRYNEKMALERLTQKVDTNFTKDDLHVTLTYADDFLPDQAQATKDIKNFIRRVRGWRILHDYPPVKYVYVIEWSDGDGRRKRVHHHLILSGMPREAVKALWGKGRASVDELVPNKGSLAALVKYMAKQPGKKHSRKCVVSKNLITPKTTTADKKLNKKTVTKIVKDVKQYAPLIFEKHHPGYTLDTYKVYTSPYTAGAYIKVEMYKPRRKPTCLQPSSCPASTRTPTTRAKA